MKQGTSATGEQTYAGYTHPKDKSQAENALHSYNDVLQFVCAYFNKREETVSEMSTVMNGYELSKTEKYILHNGKMTSYIGHLLDNGTFKDGTAISQHERNVSFRENKGQTFHLTNMQVQEGHSYALLLLGDAYEINNGERVWCDYVDTLTNLPVPIKWQQAKIWFFRVKGTAEDVVIADSLRDLEPYVALAYPSVDGTKVKNRPEDPSLAYFGDIMEPTIALNRDMTSELPKDKMKWILTAYDAKEYERNDTTCWKEEQIINADYTVADNCINLKPASTFNRITRFSNEIAAKGRSYDYGNELYHLQLAYYYRPEKAERDTANYIVDLWLHTAPHGVTVDGMSGTQDDNWMQSTNRELTGELLTYVAPFVGASPSTDPQFDYEFKDANGNFLTDEDIVFKNAKYKNGTPYRLIDPWMYFAYLSKWTFIGDRKLNGYDFDYMYTPFASESLVYDYNGTVVNSDFIKGATAKSLIFLRDDMYKTWNNWNFYGTQEGFPQWPLPSTMKVNGMITAANQTGTASTVKPRILGVSQDDNTYNFSEIAEDFMAPYSVASRISIKLRDEARELWDNFGMLFVVGDPVQNVGNVGDSYFNMLQKSWSNLHRGQYVEISERGVTVRVPYYQLPLIFGGCFGDTDDNDTYYNGRHLNLLKRGFRSSVSKDLPAETRWNTGVSNILFFRLIGDKPSPWSEDLLPQVFQKSTNSQYSDSYSGDRQVAIDQFDSYGALKEVTQFTAQTYRVDAYDISTGLYHMKRRAAQPWLNTFKIGADSDIKTMADMSNAIINAEQDMITTSDYATPWAIYTPGNKTLTLLFSKENYSLKSEYNKEQIALNGRFKGDQVLSHDWTGDTDIRTQMERLVIDKSFKEVELKDLSYWFTRCEKLKSITGLENLNTASVTNMDAMFSACESLETLDLSALDTRNVKRMNYLFANCKKLKSLNVRGQNFSTQNVVNMTQMFKNCSSLTSLDLRSFSGESVGRCEEMFYGCSQLKNLNISAFNADEYVGVYNDMFVSVPNTLVSYINILLKEEIKEQIPGRKNADNNTIRAILAENNSGQQTLIFMYDPNDLKVGYSGDIKTKYNSYDGLTVKQVFKGDQVLNTGNGIPGWARNTKLTKVFFDESFKTSPASMYAWFRDCVSLTEVKITKKLRTKDVKSMESLFENCSSLTKLDLRYFMTDNVENMRYMFRGCEQLTDIQFYDFMDYESYFKTTKVNLMTGMFEGCKDLSSIDFSPNFTTANVQDMGRMFSGCENLWELKKGGLGNNVFDSTSKVLNMFAMFKDCRKMRYNNLVSDFDTRKVSNMSEMFYNCSILEELDLSGFNTESITNVASMFQGCNALKKLNIISFKAPKLTNSSNVADMGKNMNGNCAIYMNYDVNTLIQNYFKSWSHVTVMKPSKALLLKNGRVYELHFLGTTTNYKVGNTYNGLEIVNVWSDVNIYAEFPQWRLNLDDTYKKIEKVVFDSSGLTSLNLRNFDTSKVKNMAKMFEGCKNLESLDVSTFNTSNVTTMWDMFSGCSKLRSLDLRSFCTSNVSIMAGMFYGCSSLTNLDVSSFDTKNSKSIYIMFRNCSKLPELDLRNFDTRGITDEWAGTFAGCTSLRKLRLTSDFISINGMESAVPVFKDVSGMAVCVEGGNMEDVRQNFTQKLGFVEGVTGRFYDGEPSKVAQVIWTEGNKTLYFINDIEYHVGDSYGGQTITKVWSGTNVTNTNTTSETGWRIAQCEKVVFEKSFADVRPKSTAWWFYGKHALKSIEGIENLNTSEVTNMNYMFNGTGNLKSLDVTHFNTEKVTKMAYMFYGCSSLESIDVSGFNTSEVTSMNNMFGYCNALTELDIRNFNTAKVESINDPFEECKKLKSMKVGSGFNLDHYNKTNTSSTFSNVKDLEILTPDAETQKIVRRAFVDKLGFVEDTKGRIVVEGSQIAQIVWTDGNKTLTFMYKYPYKEGDKYNGMKVTKVWKGNDVLKSGVYTSGGKTGTVWSFYNPQTVVFDESFADMQPTTTSYWFANCSALTTIQGMENLNTSKVTSMASMFNGCSSLKSLNLSKFNVGEVTTMSRMFQGCSALGSLSLSSFDPRKVTTTERMFSECRGLTSITFGTFNTVSLTNTSFMFYNCKKISSLNLSTMITDKVTNMKSMFDGCETLTSLNLSGIKTGKVTDMSSMFKNCKKLTFSDLGSDFELNTESATTMRSMFSGCSSLDRFGGLLCSKSTANVTDMSYMFESCTKLKFVDAFKAGTTTWDTKNVTDMSHMFYNCTSLNNLTFDRNTSKVTNMSYMFYNCRNLETLVFKGNTSNVTNMEWMFVSCLNLKSMVVDEFITDKVTKYSQVFANVSGLVVAIPYDIQSSNDPEIYIKHFTKIGFKKGTTGSFKYQGYGKIE